MGVGGLGTVTALANGGDNGGELQRGHADDEGDGEHGGHHELPRRSRVGLGQHVIRGTQVVHPEEKAIEFLFKALHVASHLGDMLAQQRLVRIGHGERQSTRHVQRECDAPALTERHVISVHLVHEAEAQSLVLARVVVMRPVHYAWVAIGLELSKRDGELGVCDPRFVRHGNATCVGHNEINRHVSCLPR